MRTVYRGYLRSRPGNHYKNDKHHGVDEHLVHRNMRVFLGNLVRYFIPQDHPRPLGVGLGHKGKLLSGSLFRHLECETENTSNCVSAENSQLCEREPLAWC